MTSLVLPAMIIMDVWFNGSVPLNSDKVLLLVFSC